jgi:type VI secretion system protein ImpH
MGYTGPLGVLPHRYTELMMQRCWVKDHALRDFLDGFNHRFVSLFYRAWEKYRFPVAYEQGRDDRFSFYLAALVGMATRGLTGRLAVEDQGLLFYTGLFSQHPRSASALEGIVRDYFESPAKVIQFHGRWVRLGEENETRLRVQNSTLGINAVCGSQIWDRQSKFRVRVGPISLDRLLSFLPGGRPHDQLMQLTRLFAGMECDFDVQFVLTAREVPRWRLAGGGEDGAYLGWTSWLKTRAFTRDADDTVLRCSI